MTRAGETEETRVAGEPHRPSSDAEATRAPEVGYQSRLASAPGLDDGERHRVGDTIGGRYEVLALHLGSMGVVYATFDRELGLPRALKTLRRRFEGDLAMRALFAEEAALWVRIEKHPYVVRAYRVDHSDDRPYVVAEYVRGRDGMGADLRSWLGHPRLTLPLAAEMALQVAQGMQHAVRKVQGLVHRDLKPANVLVDERARAMVTDFGLARAAQSGAGTPAYMTPEQWRGDALGAWTDIYAYGAIVYEMVTGHRLFAAGEIAEWRAAHLGIRPLPPRRLNSALTEDAEAFVLRCLAKEAAARPGSWDEVVDEAARWYHRLTGAPVILDFSAYEPTADELTVASYSLDQLGKHAEALQASERALTLDPRSVTAWNNKGASLNSLGRSAEALEAYDRALALDSGDAVTLSNRAIALAALGRHDEAIAGYDRALAVQPDEPAVWKLKAWALTDRGRFDEALGALRRLLVLEPTDAVAWSKKGEVLDRLGRDYDALEAFDRAINLVPSLVPAWHDKGAVLTRAGRFEEALAAFDRALALDPKHLESVADRGLALRGLGRHKQALAACEQAVALRPGEAGLWANKATALTEVGRLEDAVVDYDHALQLDPGLAFAWRGKASTLSELKLYRQAVAAYDCALALEPANEAAQQGRMDARERLGGRTRREGGRKKKADAAGTAAAAPKADEDPALIVAAREDQPAVVDALLKAGAAADTTNGQGETALMWAAARDSLPIARALIAAGASVNHRAPGRYWATPLSWAIGRLGAEPKDMEKAMFGVLYGLHFRPPEKDSAVAMLLLEAGADPNGTLGNDKDTPLMLAARLGQEAVVDRLLARGADATLRDSLGNSVVAQAHSHLSGDLQHRMEARLREVLRRTPGVHGLIESARGGDLDRVKTLLAQGVPVDAGGDSQETALIAAAGAGHVPVVQALLAAGSDVNRRDRWWTALDQAALNGHASVVRVLLTAGAKLERVSALTGNGTGALSFAAIYGHLDVLQALIEARAPIAPKALAREIAERTDWNIPNRDEVVATLQRYIETWK